MLSWKCQVGILSHYKVIALYIIFNNYITECVLIKEEFLYHNSVEIE